MIVGLALTILVREHKLLVLPDWELPIRPSVRGDGSGAPGFEIVAGWEKPYSKYFDYAAGMLSWTDGHDVFVGSDFAHGVGLGLANPPERWMSDEGGIYWTTHEHELWTAGRQRGARVIWRFKGAAYDSGAGPDGGLPGHRASRLSVRGVAVEGGGRGPGRWRVDKEDGPGVAALVHQGPARLAHCRRRRRVHGQFGRRESGASTDQPAVRRCSQRDSERSLASTTATSMAPMDTRPFVRPKRADEVRCWLGMRSTSASSAPASDRPAPSSRAARIFWIEGSGLRAASVQGGEESLLAAMSGTDYHVVPAGDSVYVHDLKREMVYRVPRRSGPAPVEIPTGEGAVETFTSNGSTLFWVAEQEIRKVDRNGTTAVVVAADAKPESAVVADETSVYFTRPEGTLWRVPVSGGTPTKIADLRSPTGPPVVTTAMNRTVALRGDDVYFVSFARGAVARIKKSGGAARILADGIPGPGALVLDGEFIYLLSADYKNPMACKAKLLRLPASGGKVTELASGARLLERHRDDQERRLAGDDQRRAGPYSQAGGEARGAPDPRRVDRSVRGARGGYGQRRLDVRLGCRSDPEIRRGEIGASGRRIGSAPSGEPMSITGRTMHFTDLHSSKGIPSANLYSLELVD